MKISYNYTGLSMNEFFNGKKYKRAYFISVSSLISDPHDNSRLSTYYDALVNHIGKPVDIPRLKNRKLVGVGKKLVQVGFCGEPAIEITIVKI